MSECSALGICLKDLKVRSDLKLIPEEMKFENGDDCLNLKKTPDISVIIPVFNEEESIGIVLKMLSEINWLPYTVEIIAVDDGSTDDTAKEISKYPSVKYIPHPKNMGKGAALKTGFKEAKGTVVVIQDADMEYSPESIPELVRPILTGTADVVFGSRFTGKCEGMSGSHYIGNKLLSLTASILYDEKITDIMTGSKAFRRSVLDSFMLTQDGFGVEIELTSGCLRTGCRYVEVPIGYAYRTTGVSKIRHTDGFKSLLKLFSSRLL